MTDSMYDLVAADVPAAPAPEEVPYDTGVPGVVNGTPKLGDYGTIALDDIDVTPDVPWSTFNWVYMRKRPR